MRAVKAVVASLDDVVLRWEGLALAGLIAIMTAIVFAQVVFRYLLAIPLVWSEELARYLFVWVTMIGSAMAVRQGLHYGLDILVKPLPRGMAALAGLLGSAIIAAIAITLVWQGVKESAGATRHFASSMDISMAWFYSALPIGGLLMLWHLAARMLASGIGASPIASHG
jgi:TRAP-type C4-dicarboxylate transport system permease small subunit